MSEQKPVAWRDAIQKIRNGLDDDTPSAFDNSGYRRYAGIVLDSVEDALGEILAAPPEQPALTLDAIYAAWHGAGVDIAGGDWNRFVGMLPHCMTAQPAPAQQWLPIETAPKDGTEVLGWREDCGVLLMRWIAPCVIMSDHEMEAASTGDDDWMEEEDWFYADFVQGGRLDGREAPTHWMPLPAAPKEPT